MGMQHIRIPIVRWLGALLFATLLMGCYGGDWGGESPDWGGGGYSGYSNNYYSNNAYRGYGGYSQPGLFGGYPPAHEAWDASTRGRASYSGGRGHGEGGHDERGGEHGGGGHQGGHG